MKFAWRTWLAMTAMVVAAGTIGRGWQIAAPAPGQATPGPAPQAPPRDTSASATGTAVIRGTIRAADNGQPLRRVQVRAAGTELREGRMAETDAQGRYEIRDLPRGRYVLNASKGGFVALQYGQQRPFEAGRPLDIANGQTIERVDFTLPRASVIAGQILDEAGEPVMDVQVSAMRYQFVQGQRRLMPTGRTAMSNDIGEFRLFGLSPGQYFISATLRDPLALAQSVQAAGSSGSGYAPTYYPGTTSSAEAQRLNLGQGQTLGGLIIQLSPVRTVQVSGRVLTAAGQPSTGGAVVMMPKGEISSASMAPAQIRPDGTFTFNSLTPGLYSAVAMSGNPTAGGLEYAPAVDVNVPTANLTGLEFRAVKFSSLTGRIVLDGTDGAAPPAVNLMTIPAVPGALNPNAPPTRVADDRSFDLKAPPGRQLLRVNGAIGLWAIRTVRLNGRDVTDDGFEVSPNEDLSGFEVELTNRATTIGGAVTDPRGQPATDYVVVSYSQERTRWTTVSRHISISRPDQQGRYRVRVPAGNYHLVAVDYIEQGEQFDPEFLEKMIPSASTLSISSTEQKTLDLKLVVR